mgnify:CR=1 FL=1
MTKEELRELIKSLIKEYMGTVVKEQLGDFASSGPVSYSGNNVTSQRSRWDTDEQEIEFYTNTGAPFGGAEGQQTRGMEKSRMGNPNSQKQVRF